MYYNALCPSDAVDEHIEALSGGQSDILLGVFTPICQSKHPISNNVSHQVYKMNLRSRWLHQVQKLASDCFMG